MAKIELLQYINRELAKGVSLSFVKETLRKNQWSEEDIEEAVKTLFPPTEPISVDKNVNSFGMINPYPKTLDKKKFRKKIIVWSLAIFVFLVLSGGAVYGYSSGYLVSMPKVAREALTSIEKSRSMNFDTTIILDWSNMKNGSLYDNASMGLSASRKASFNINGQYDFFHPDDIKGTLRFVPTVGAVTADLEFLLVDSVLYANLKQLPEIAFFNQFSQLENKWVKFPLPRKEDLKNDNPLSQSLTDTFSGINPLAVASLKDEQKNKILEIYHRANFLKVTKKMPVESIDGVASYHFAFEPDYPGIENFLDELEAYLNTLSSYGVKAYDSDEAYQNMINSIKGFKGDAWVSRRTGYPTKLTVSMGIVDPRTPENGELKIETTSLFKNWNVPITVTAPEESITFDDLVRAIFGTSNS